MLYEEYLEELCNEYLSRPADVSAVFAELRDELIMTLVENDSVLRETLMGELRTWEGLKSKARDKAAYDRIHTNEDEVYEKWRQDQVDQRKS